MAWFERAFALARRRFSAQVARVQSQCTWPMDENARLKQDLKRLMVSNLMLQVSAEEIGDDQPLFGPGSLGLDSVDALQLVVALDKQYRLKIADPETARAVLQSVSSMAEAVSGHLRTQAQA
jgi:acyl carrier protein